MWEGDLQRDLWALFLLRSYWQLTATGDSQSPFCGSGPLFVSLDPVDGHMIPGWH